MNIIVLVHTFNVRLLYPVKGGKQHWNQYGLIARQYNLPHNPDSKKIIKLSNNNGALTLF